MVKSNTFRISFVIPESHMLLWLDPRLSDSTSSWPNWNIWLYRGQIEGVTAVESEGSPLSNQRLFQLTFVKPNQRGYHGQVEDFLTQLQHGRIEDITAAESRALLTCVCHGQIGEVTAAKLKTFQLNSVTDESETWLQPNPRLFNTTSPIASWSWPNRRLPKSLSSRPTRRGHCGPVKDFLTRLCHGRKGYVAAIESKTLPTLLHHGLIGDIAAVESKTF